MAHCSSSLLHSSSLVPHKSAHNEAKPQDLLPPRKRLLAGLKHAKASLAPVSSTPASPPPAPALQMEVHVDATHTSPAPPYSLLLHSATHKCFSCGDAGVLLHRVPCLASSSSYHCSACVLAINKNMYCVLCYQVLQEGSSSSSSELLTCCRCQRLTHLECTLKIWSPPLEGAGLTLCRDCYARNNGQSREPPNKKQRTGGVWRFKEAFVPASSIKLPLPDIKALAAAQIVAIIAKKGALEAKQRAEALAKSAACAAVHAKTALETLYKQNQKEAYVQGHSDAVVSVTQKEEGNISASKTPKSLKRRALSAIVASEMLCSRACTMANHMGLTENVEIKQKQLGSHAKPAEAMLFQESMADDSSHGGTQRARLTIKQRKMLSSIGVQHPPKARKSMILKCSQLAAKRNAKFSNLSSRGRLGAIVSHVLASNKLPKISGRSPPSKAGKSGLQCASLSARNEVSNDACSMDLMAMRSDCIVNESLPILRGTIAATGACDASHRGLFV